MLKSDRKKLCTALNSLIYQEPLVEEVEEFTERGTARASELLELYAGVTSCRHLYPRGNVMRSEAHQLLVFTLGDDGFSISRSAYRTKATFEFILGMIREDKISHSNSYKKQRDILVQLAITLEWYGASGNGNSVGRVMRTYGVGAGTVSTHVRRVQRVLLRYYKRFVVWPSAARRITSSVYHRERFGMEGVVGMVDGTPIIFDLNPHLSGGIHYNHKCRYSFNAQVVCDEDKRILSLFTGWPGSCNGSTIFAQTLIHNNPRRYFSRHKYLLGDTGYPISSRLTIPCKKPASALPNNTVFNETLSSARVVNENCIGLLKNRWMNLKGERTQLNRPVDFKTVNNQVFACAMLHEIALAMRYIWENEENTDTRHAQIVAENESDELTAGRQLRESIKNAMLGRR